jgi:nucleotide-binding universal stress UspA family protein
VTLPKNILVPTDFSEHSTRALDYAVELAHKLDATIHVLNVMGLQFAEYPIAVTAAMIDDLMEINRKTVADLVAARSARASFAPSTFEAGDVRIAIEKAVRDLGIELIVMGTHGRTGLKRLVLGSVAEAVARSVLCPVLLIR